MTLSVSARLGAVSFIHRFGSTLNAHLHFQCVVIDGVFDTNAADDVVFHAATGIDANAIAAAEALVRRRMLRSSVPTRPVRLQEEQRGRHDAHDSAV